MWDNYGNWREFAKLENVKDIRSKIAGDRVWTPNYVSSATSYIFNYAIDETLQSNTQKVPTVVDFGCGLGRNGPMLKRYFPRLVGVDLPEMIARAKHVGGSTTEQTYDQLYSSIDDLIAGEEFCVLYDCVALQHIVDYDYLSDLIGRLSAKVCFRTVVSVHFEDGTTQIYQRVLQEKGWRVWHYELDVLSFEGTPHTVVTLRQDRHQLSS